MRLRLPLFLAFALLQAARVLSASSVRLAVIEAGGEPAKSSSTAATVENRLCEALSARLVGQPGITVVDHEDIGRILQEQNMQFTSRFSAEEAVRIGKLLGVQQMVIVHVTDATWSAFQQKSGRHTTTIGTVVVGALARLVDVETGTILSQPSSSFQESVPISETSSSFRSESPQQKSSGGNPYMIAGNEFGKAAASVLNDLAAKLITSFTAAPPAPAKSVATLVAGIAGGSVYINQGAGAGVKPGDRFQVSRMVSVGVMDPATKQPIQKKQQVCVLVIADVQETSASGSCSGGLPQSEDLAESMRH